MHDVFVLLGSGGASIKEEPRRSPILPKKAAVWIGFLPCKCRVYLYTRALPS
jgi:hypothetical protein